ncbi:MAG: 30S ribosomal protein S13 [Candidatus Caenarcaniphilales bacterium]|nr:30S ribosomal protein S13 [Candidatus Caenarcaniphilales bacterium]
MTRIAGVDVPSEKRAEVALTYIYGIGRQLSKTILTDLNIDFNTKAKALTPEQVNQIQKYISDKEWQIEGDLRREINSHIHRLLSISCYRGIRHREGLPVRGQITRNKGGKRRERRRKRMS